MIERRLTQIVNAEFTQDDVVNGDTINIVPAVAETQVLVKAVKTITDVTEAHYAIDGFNIGILGDASDPVGELVDVGSTLDIKLNASIPEAGAIISFTYGNTTGTTVPTGMKSSASSLSKFKVDVASHKPATYNWSSTLNSPVLFYKATNGTLYYVYHDMNSSGNKYKSTDGGTNWNQIGSQTSYDTFAFDAENKILYWRYGTTLYSYDLENDASAVAVRTGMAGGSTYPRGAFANSIFMQYPNNTNVYMTITPIANSSASASLFLPSPMDVVVSAGTRLFASYDAVTETYYFLRADDTDVYLIETTLDLLTLSLASETVYLDDTNSTTTLFSSASYAEPQNAFQKVPNKNKVMFASANSKVSILDMETKELTETDVAVGYKYPLISNIELKTPLVSEYDIKIKTKVFGVKITGVIA